MRRPLLTAALLWLAVSGGARADHQIANLKAFKTVCLTVVFREQDKENEAVLKALVGRMFAALDRAGIPVEDGCKLEGSVGGQTQLNLSYVFTTTGDGATYEAALEGWLYTDGPYTDVTLWRDSYFGSLDAGAGGIQAADSLDLTMDAFVEQWGSVH